MATLNLKDIVKIYPHSGDRKRARKKKGGPEEKTNLQVTEKGVIAVQQFSLDIADKEFIVLVGPSGCGKSTTLRMVAGLEEISEGELYIDGKLMNDVEPKDRDIAMVFQSYALYPHMTVYENMAFPLTLKKLSKEEIDRRVKEAAAILDITQYLERKPKALSGGQRQRVAIGRAMVRDPKVFLMDEPVQTAQGGGALLGAVADEHPRRPRLGQCAGHGPSRAPRPQQGDGPAVGADMQLMLHRGEEAGAVGAVAV